MNNVCCKRRENLTKGGSFGHKTKQEQCFRRRFGAIPLVCRYTMPPHPENGAQQHAPFWCKGTNGQRQGNEKQGDKRKCGAQRSGREIRLLRCNNLIENAGFPLEENTADLSRIYFGITHSLDLRLVEFLS
ncbi:MAG: hypothetical protein AAB419_12810 [Pseudomonadota bacterium]|uniref:Uncharacterized protein n=1 Tax=Cupriavidus metallidurans TaxID=119219 RepID=A0A482IMJ0_9BURK|nr:MULTISPECIES: hypothetical protein [Cupriavidus]QBP08254.1 hypothetical protein DDF84_000150 [Cupriavidus metallidurans]